jgi:hypothetical protein
MILLNYIRNIFWTDYCNIACDFSWMKSCRSITIDSTSKCNTRHITNSKNSK